MRSRTKHLVALGLAGAMLAAGLASVFIGGRGPVPASAASQHTIEILASGFNPALCTVNRNDSTVYFLNKDTKVRRVIRPAFTADPDAPPEWDSGDIQPGQTVVAFVVTSQVHIRYRDANIPEHTGEIIAPQSNNAAANCSPLPPTPTPTNTPTPTATPTPTPPRPPTPEACARLLANPAGCQVAPRIATDGPAR